MANQRYQTRPHSLPLHMLEEKPSRSRCITAICFSWKMVTCILSHVTLLLLVVSYCVGGAYLFQHLEKPHELQIKTGIQHMRKNLTAKIWKFSDTASVLSENDWVISVTSDLANFENQILTAMKKEGWDGDEDTAKSQWTFAGSLFYSIIVITTIGYGHISPRTDWGKVTTIFYAIIGIPLMLLCLSNIGDVMATSFRFIYWRVCCFICTRSSNHRSRSRNRIRQQSMRVYHCQPRSQPSLSRPIKMRPKSCSGILQHSYSDPEICTVERNDLLKGHRRTCHQEGANYVSTLNRGLRCSNRQRYNDRLLYDRHAVKQDRYLSHSKHQFHYIEEPKMLPLQLKRAISVRPELLPNRMQSESHTQFVAKASRRRSKSVDPRIWVPEFDDDDEIVCKTPIISNRYAINELDHHHNDLKSMRSQSMPRSPFYKKNYSSVESPESTNDFLLHERYKDEHRDKNIQLSGQRIKKPHLRERSERLPPSPRIMSPMGFAVKRQVHRRPSYDYDYDSAFADEWSDSHGEFSAKNRPVPIWLCIFLVIGYILGGAALFAYWEQWSFLDSAYFCFITLTTIGFGDFVPAKGVKDESEQSIAYCSLYLLFGISLLAMSFNLVQEEFISNVKNVARRLGILKDEEEDD